MPSVIERLRELEHRTGDDPELQKECIDALPDLLRCVSAVIWIRERFDYGLMTSVDESDVLDRLDIAIAPLLKEQVPR